MILSDIHVHTTFCDGKNSAEEMISEAISKDFISLGFSGHSYTSFDDGWCMSEEDTEKYIETTLSLRKKYSGTIDILLGTERDFFADEDRHTYNYIIGSSHYVKVGNEYLTVDKSAEEQTKIINGYFGRDTFAFIKAYYAQEAEIIKKTNCDVIGHFDLVTKFNEGGKMFDENSDAYKKIVYQTLEELVISKPIFEVNTGAMTRGYRTRPYPADFAALGDRCCTVNHERPPILFLTMFRFTVADLCLPPIVTKKRCSEAFSTKRKSDCARGA